MDAYIEKGSKKSFAVAVDWPGWARSGADEAAALAALFAYADRYRRALDLRAPNFITPDSAAELKVVDRVAGNATTDFGAPGAIPPADFEVTNKTDIDRLVGLLRRAWRAFDDAADAAGEVVLPPSGPRGGGRSLAKIRDHYLEAEDGYLHAMGGKARRGAGAEEIRAAFVETVYARARGELPDAGPRGGRRWPAAFAIRRSAWHALDHAWEIEDRGRR